MVFPLLEDMGLVQRMDQWGQWLGELGITEFAGRQLLPFEDPGGQQLYLVNDHGADFGGEIWQRPDISEENALRGFYSVVISIPSIDQLADAFKKVMNYEEI